MSDPDRIPTLVWLSALLVLGSATYFLFFLGHLMSEPAVPNQGDAIDRLLEWLVFIPWFLAVAAEVGALRFRSTGATLSVIVFVGLCTFGAAIGMLNGAFGPGHWLMKLSALAGGGIAMVGHVVWLGKISPR